jgi:cytochrome bd-type quinol oxidase subunit 2
MIDRWQHKLLPFMQITIVVLVIFYIIASYFQYRQFNDRILSESFSINKQLDILRTTNGNVNPLLIKAYLEAYIVQSRQRNLELFLNSRTWIKYLGFITGMILCVVGAIFILGKLTDQKTTQASGEGNQFKFSFASNSPGIILSFLGTILIMTTILTNQEIEKRDSFVYFTPVTVSSDNYIIPDSLKGKKPDNGKKPPDGF